MEKMDNIARFIAVTREKHPLKVPAGMDVERFTDDLIGLLFSANTSFEIHTLEMSLDRVKKQIVSLLKDCPGPGGGWPATTAGAFFEKLIPVYTLLLDDAAFIASIDPAAGSMEEVISTYPGFFAISVHRFAHELSGMEVPYLPRMMSEYAHRRTGIDIHPRAVIGSPFAIDHGTGIVIGETTTVGDHVIMYQGVTLGALSVSKADASSRRHPTIGDHSILYAGCTILGGNTVIGHHSVIGGNVWLTSGVGPWSVVYHNSEVRIRNKATNDNLINFII